MYEAYTALSDIFSIFCLKVNFLSIVIASSKTLSLVPTLIEFIYNISLR